MEKKIKKTNKMGWDFFSYFLSPSFLAIDKETGLWREIRGAVISEINCCICNW